MHAARAAARRPAPRRRASPSVQTTDAHTLTIVHYDVVLVKLRHAGNRRLESRITESALRRMRIILQMATDQRNTLT